MSPMFVPGPVDVDPEVAAAQTSPMLPHRSKEFEDLFRRAESKVRKAFYTHSRVLITASSGTGLHEAAVRNFVHDNGRVLSCVNGAFAARWHEVAVTNGKQVDKIETEWNQPITPELVAAALEEHQYDAILVVHNETSTGLENPIEAIAKTVHAVSPETIICVDAVSSLGGVKIDMDGWGLDMLLTSSQKALALPPGLGFAAVSDKALAKAETVPNRGWYFDLVRMEKHRIKDSTPATPAVSLIYALDKQMDRILAEGLENRFARYQAMAEKVQHWVARRPGFSLYAPAGYWSKTVTTITKPESLEVKALNTFLQPRDMRVAGGYGVIKPFTFRIAHMGELTMADIDDLLTAMDEFLGA